MALKIENVFVSEDDPIPVILKASTEIDTIFKGYHVYKDIWRATVNEKLETNWSMIIWWINKLFVLKRTLL